MNDFAIGDLTILEDAIDNYILQAPIAGLDSPEYRQTEYQKPGEDGSVVSSSNYDSRPISLQGVVKGDTLQDYETARQSLAEACRINKDSTGFPELTRLTFTTAAGNRYFVDVIIRKPVFDIVDVRHSNFFINAVAPDPQIYGATARSSGLVERQSGSGFVWPFIWPFTWGTTSGGTASLVNGGNLETWPILTITGSATNPFIYSSTLDRYMQINYEMTASDVLVIDMKEKTITLNGTTSLLVDKATGSQWFWLEPGANVINFSTGSGSDEGTLSIDWYDAYLGV